MKMSLFRLVSYAFDMLEYLQKCVESVDIFSFARGHVAKSYSVSGNLQTRHVNESDLDEICENSNPIRLRPNLNL